MAEDVLVPLSFFAFLTAIIFGPMVLKYRDRARMHETLRAAFERGQPVPPELVDALQRDVKKSNTPDSDLRKAVILIGVALGLVVTGLCLGSIAEEAMYSTMAGAAIPGFIGLGYFALWFFTRNTKVS